MQETLNCEASKVDEKKNLRYNNKNNWKNPLMKRFYHEHKIQVYMYDFMYFYPKSMLKEEYFPYTRSFF